MVRGLEKSHVLHQAPWNINIPYTPYNPYNPLYFSSHPKKTKKNLVEWKKVRTFAPAIPNRALSSAGLEHLPYKQRVGGSNPSAPTILQKASQKEAFSFPPPEESF